jgi:hypothetical protein
MLLLVLGKRQVIQIRVSDMYYVLNIWLMRIPSHKMTGLKPHVSEDHVRASHLQCKLTANVLEQYVLRDPYLVVHLFNKQTRRSCIVRRLPCVLAE